MLALTRDVSSSIARCELTHQVREPIDVDRARATLDEAQRHCLIVNGLKAPVEVVANIHPVVRKAG